MFEFHKAGFSKRFGAGMFDIIILIILTVGLLFLFNSLTGYDSVYSSYEQSIETYEKKFGIVFDISSDEYSALSEEERANWDAAYVAMLSESSIVETYDRLVKLSLFSITASVLLSCLVLEFALPLFFKNGQTIGKKLFGICLMSSNQVKVRAVQVFTRAIVGKFAVEIMIPLLTVVLLFLNQMSAVLILLTLLIVIAQAVVFVTTKGSRLIHDVAAQTVVVDYSTQTIFENFDEMIKAKNEYHEKMVEKTEY